MPKPAFSRFSGGKANQLSVVSCQWSVVSCQLSGAFPWEGEAPAEPQATLMTVTELEIGRAHV